MLERISSLTWHHPRRVLAAVFVFVAVAGFFGHDVEHHLKAAGFTDSSSESEVAGRVLAKAQGHSAVPTLVVLLRARDGGRLRLQDPRLQAEVRRLVREVGRSAHVARVVDPLADPRAGFVARDGRSLVIPAYLDTQDVEDAGGVADESVRRHATSTLFKVGYAGYAPSFNEVNDQTRRDLTNAELIAFPVLAILLLLVFRSAVAAVIPLLVGGISIIGTMFALRIMAGFADTSLFALNLSSGLSLGLAVDYALLLVSRSREETAKLGYTYEAHRRTVTTAGRAALFSGLTVAAALASLTLMPQRFLYSIGFAGLLVGVLCAVMAVLAVPAMLAWLGPNVEKWSIRRGPSVSDASGGWFRLASTVMRRPVVVALATTVALLALAVPLIGTHLTGPSAEAVAPGQQSYAVNHYLARHYGRALTEGVTVVVDGRSSRADLASFRKALASVAHVDTATPLRPVGSDVAVATLGLDVKALSDQGQAAVKAIRALPAPPGTKLLVAGNTAGFIDQKASLTHHAPLVVLLICLLTVVLLFLLTGSVLLPLKTLLMNALTLSAVLGILVLVFEKKVGVGLLSYPGPYSVEVTSLVFLFVVTFALATDYAVLVMARIKELRDTGLPNQQAVAHGIGRTGRIISAAAVMIAVVFASFGVSPIFFMKQIAVGMALGVLIDATVVRALLVPSLMRLLGEANWWAPAYLRKVHDRFGLREG